MTTARLGHTMTRRCCLAAAGGALAMAFGAGPARAGDVEPRLLLPSSSGHAVALTLDACMGETDHRILDPLVAERIPATIFATRRWIRRNPAAVAILKANADLFDVENHGAEHVPAITDRPEVFGLPTAGSLAAVEAEIDGGAAAIAETFGRHPRWYRDASARYSLDAVALIARKGLKLAGYSVNGDIGASLPAAAAEKRIATAHPGDVIIAHINQPSHSAGAGVIAGVRALKGRGMRFVRLDEAFPPHQGS